MKIIGKRGSGKTTFLVHFLQLLIRKGIIKHENIWIFCPIYPNQQIWHNLSIQPNNTTHLSLNETTYNKLFVFDDLQGDLKKKKLRTFLQKADITN